MATITITLPNDTSVCDGKIITFRAPCNCTEVTGLIIEGTEYSIVSCANKPLSEIGEVFSTGSLVSVLIDKTNNKAYIQGGEPKNKYLELAGGTMTGTLKLNSTPTDSMDAVNKDYVDNIVGNIETLLAAL